MDIVADLICYTGGRLLERMDGLSDEEWAWRPTSDPDLSLQWRLDHIGELLAAPRVPVWLGVDLDPPSCRPAAGAEAAIAAVRRGLEYLLEVHADPRYRPDDPIGEVGGPFAEQPRSTFALHLADELIHHGAEASMLRDLYADRRP